MDINSNHFSVHVRRALNHLYDPDQLRLSPLVSLFGLGGRVDASLALQKILLQAIEDIRPGDETPQQSQASMMYEVLFFRYVRGYSREAVANQLGISDRQLSREQRTAIETLAQLLWNTYQLDSAAGSLPESAGETLAGEPLAGAVQQREADAGTSWVVELPKEPPASWKMTLASLVDLLRPLLRENEVTLHYDPDMELPDLLVAHHILRHSLLTILGWMIPLARQDELILEPSVAGQTLSLRLWITGRRLPGQGLDPCIGLARQLLEGIGGSLEIQQIASGAAAIRLNLPAHAQTPVLVVDDNADTLQLFQRYVQGSRYSLVGLQDPNEALRQVERLNPRIILIDVMMPHLDGWDVLTQLRMSGLTQNAAILVCSILPQEGLARSLGADGFIQKPVLPQDFLAALDRQMEPFDQEPKPK